MKTKNEIDSKFRFVILAAKRAKQLLHGAKPKIKSKSKNPIRIAQKEVRDGLIDFEIVEIKKEEILEPTEEGFIGEEIAQMPEGMEKDEPKVKKKKPKKKPEVEKKEKPQKKPVKKSEKTKKTGTKTTAKKTPKKKT